MKEASRTYIEHVEGFADIAIEITRDGLVVIKSWPTHLVSSETLCKVLRTLSDNIEKIREEQS